MSIYPTKEEIMAISYKLKPSHIWQVLLWRDNVHKKEGYIQMNKEKKEMSLAKLIDYLNLLLPAKKRAKIKFGPIYCYQPLDKTIVLDRNNPSILSTLHEYGHHLYGPDELDACTWSINLFKECFPKAFQKLKWKGHMLVKKNANTK